MLRYVREQTVREFIFLAHDLKTPFEISKPVHLKQAAAFPGPG